MKPYFDDGLVTLYHGDCLEITEWLTADVLVTDPPYGMSYSSGRVKGRDVKIAGDDSLDVRDEVLGRWGTRPSLVFGRWNFPRPALTKARLIWSKGSDPGMGDLKFPWGNSDEEIYVWGEGFSGIRGPNVLTFNKPPVNNRPDHPTPKPVALMEALIAKCPPGVVADPFAGSGSTLVAAQRLGRRAIGVELEEKYCEIAARRLSQQPLDLEVT